MSVLISPPTNGHIPEKIAQRLKAKPPHSQRIDAWREAWIGKLLASGIPAKSLDLYAEWLNLQHASDKSDLAAFFDLHDDAQLDRLGKELGRPVDSFARRDAKIAAFVNSGTAGRLLPLPRSLKG